jgi:predicted hydrocarbon binding protein
MTSDISKAIEASGEKMVEKIEHMVLDFAHVFGGTEEMSRVSENTAQSILTTLGFQLSKSSLEVHQQIEEHNFYFIERCVIILLYVQEEEVDAGVKGAEDILEADFLFNIYQYPGENEGTEPYREFLTVSFS